LLNETCDDVMLLASICRGHEKIGIRNRTNPVD